jgi:polyhydroxyalkanoate synthase
MARQTTEKAAPQSVGSGDRQAASLDALAHAVRARATRGLSPAARVLAWQDWALHLALSPGKQVGLWKLALREQQRFVRYALDSAANRARKPCVEPLAQDRRFADPAWQQWPFNLIHQGFLLQQQWWHEATTGVHGVTQHHERMVNFAVRQWLDIWSPANFIPTNPEVLHALVSSGGASLRQGGRNFAEDLWRLLLDEPPAGTEEFVVGRDVAITPGKVVFRNHLIELIQYAPTTSDVHAEPVLIVPSWIMKYYILDLSPHNSMVRYLVEQGHTVFIISWRNPDSDDRDLGLDDYRQLGVMEALDAVNAIVPDRKIQAVGYCLGGTLLLIAAAAMARDGDERLHGLTLLASEADFRDSGEISLFIDESQLAWLEAGMWDKGYLEGNQMAGAFQMLNSRDLLWSRRVREYLLGERQALNDLMAWNTDLTRMPYRMHSEYLRQLYLGNDLAEGRLRVGDKPIALTDLRVPLFVVGTVRDHVAPWPSVYKLHLLTDAELTFVLTSGGHNAGVVSEPGHPRRSFQIATRGVGERYVDPERWRAQAPLHQGSWWPAWQQWLARHSAGRVAPPALGSARKKKYTPLEDAPGIYVRMR